MAKKQNLLKSHNNMMTNYSIFHTYVNIAQRAVPTKNAVIATNPLIFWPPAHLKSLPYDDADTVK